MKDIDFDELDRAVNSLISPDSNPPPVAASTTPLPPASTTETPSAAAATPPLAERRSSGRFMDVVHPSSDMRTSPVPPRPASRESMTIEPPTSAPAIETPSVPEVPKPAASSWPDPIDVHEAAAKSPDVPPASTPESLPDSKDATAPLESPFLADAKVEKRPLGAFSNEVHESSPVAPAVAPAEEVKHEEKLLTTDSLNDKPRNSDHPIETDTPLPAELQAGLLSIEANEDPSANKSDTASSTVAATPEPAVGPTSITQQYTEQASTGDKPAGTVFDTEAYKKPQVNSKKKKSGWLVVLWIFLLLVVGAGIGAAVYFFVLPRL